MERLAFSHMESIPAIIFVGVTVNLPVAKQVSHILVKAISSNYELCLKVITVFRRLFLSPEVQNACLCFLNLIFLTKLDGIVLDLFSIFEAEQAITKTARQQQLQQSIFQCLIWADVKIFKASHSFWKYIFSFWKVPMSFRSKTFCQVKDQSTNKVISAEKQLLH